MALGEGSVLGGYRIVRLIGRGGMGAVYLADDVRLGRKVALKVLSSETAEIPAVRERFVRESQLAASLDHPHILPIYEAGEADGQLFIAMRYVPGPDLEGIIARDGPLALERTVALIDQIGSALDAAHAAGLIHRDVKPGNILVAPGSAPGTDHAYLTDFGLTKQAEYSAALTRSGQLLGSVGYVAPELIENRPVDARVDIYSLGCVLYECLAGTQPYPRDTEMATLYAHVQAPPPSIALVRPELPAAIDGVIAKAMAKTPEARYPSAGELARALTEAATPEAVGRHLTRGFLFADLRGYTAYVEAHGDDAGAALLDTYRRLVRDVVRRSGGAEIKTEGDSFYVVFASASEAVRAGLAIVSAAASASASDPARPISVGVGVHAGETAETAEGYVGSAVNLAARICAQAAAGEVLVSDTVRGLTRTSSEVTFTARGRKHLKGIAEPIALFRASTVVERSNRAKPSQGVPGRLVASRRRIGLAVPVGLTLAIAGVLVATRFGGFGTVPPASPSILAAGLARPTPSGAPSGQESSAPSLPGGSVAPSPGALFPDSGKVNGVVLAGTYTAAYLPGSPLLTVPAGWSGGSSPNALLLFRTTTPADRFSIDAVADLVPDPCGVRPPVPVGAEPEAEFVAWARADPALHMTSGLGRHFGDLATTEYDVEVIGAKACHDMEPASVLITAYDPGALWAVENPPTLPAGERLRLEVTSRDSQLVFVLIEAPSSEEFKTLEPLVEQILQTISFAP